MLLPWAASQSVIAGPPPDALDGLLKQRLLREAVGLAAVQVSDAGLNIRTHGVLRRGNEQRVGEDTLFELASVTKAFVALVLADAVLRRELSLDDTVEEMLPGGLKLRDTAGEPLRMIDLATHRSGLPRVPANQTRRERVDPYAHYSEERLRAFLVAWTPEVKRGARFEYSNLGYGLLAQALSHRLGRSLDQLLAERVFEPLGLKDLYIRRPLPGGDNLQEIGAALAAAMNLAQREAGGHDATKRPVPPWQFGALAGAIGLVGSIRAVGRFMQAALGLYDHPLQAAFAMCMQRRTDGEHPLHPFGLAWELSMPWSPTQTRTLFNQDGASAGFSCSLWLEPARKRGAAVLVNTFVETRSVALRALDMSLDEDKFLLPPLPESTLAPLAGKFQLADQLVVTTRHREGQLWVSANGEAELDLLLVGGRHFQSRDGALRLIFDDDPKPGRLLLIADGQRVVLQRQP